MNERLTEEFSKIALERLKNPYIIAFLISWILFNWQPILFFIFSSGDVEYKICFIRNYYSDWLFNIVFPLCSTFFYIFILPRVNNFTESKNYITFKKRYDYSKELRKDEILREEEILIAEENRQKKVRSVREGNDHEKFVENLNKTIDELQKSLSEERNNKQELILKIDQEAKGYNDLIKGLHDDINKAMQISENEKIVDERKVLELQNLLTRAENRYNVVQEENKKLAKKVDSYADELDSLPNSIKVDMIKALRRFDQRSKIIYDENDMNNSNGILEFFDQSTNSQVFYDLNMKRELTDDELVSRLFHKNTKRSHDQKIIDYAITEFMEYRNKRRR